MSQQKSLHFFLPIVVSIIVCWHGLEAPCTASEVFERPSRQFDTLMGAIRFETDIWFCDTRIPIEQPEIRERLEKEMLLALWDQPQVILWVKRAARFFPHVEKILDQYGLPEDLKYIPVIESALKPHARSFRSAVGYWQFLKPTAQQYGLRVDAMTDERRDILKSTDAACRYLKDLNDRFNSFLLAISAYNMGGYALQTEIDAQQTTDFFSLYLPLQTQEYVFKAIAVKLIFENLDHYGFHMNASDLYPAFSFDKVNLKSDFQLPITLIAASADVPFKTIKEYNPHLLGYYLSKGDISIKIPRGKAEGFKERFSTLYADWKKKAPRNIHIVRQGESLIGIANQYRMSLSSLLKLNGISQNGIIHPGDRLVVE